jgi:diacylglycerol O-acyltransferase
MSGERLSGLDASFLHLEEEATPMHVGSVMLFEGEQPDYEDVLRFVEERLDQVPRYRQRVAFVPFGQGRPRWTDDPHFNLRYHVRNTALPAPGTEEQLRNLAGRVFAQPLDRDKPLWEMWFVDGVEHGRHAVIAKNHHAMIDGIAGVDLMSVLLDTEPEPQSNGRSNGSSRWLPAPMPSRSQLLAEALVERAVVPGEIVRSARALVRRPLGIAKSVGRSLVGAGALAWAGIKPAPSTPYNERVGPHRRFAWARACLADFKQIKDSLDGSINDVVLTVVAGALRRHLERRGEDVDDLDLKVFVPVSIRSEEQRGETGNQVAGIIATLPVSLSGVLARFDSIHREMQGLKESGQALGASVLTGLAGFAPPNIMTVASRVASRLQRAVNLVVTNVPGPQHPLYIQGRELRDFFPMVPLAQNMALNIAILSYNGRINFGLTGDWDLLHDLDDLAADLEAAIEELAKAAEVELSETQITYAAEHESNGRPAAKEPVEA